MTSKIPPMQQATKKTMSPLSDHCHPTILNSVESVISQVRRYSRQQLLYAPTSVLVRMVESLFCNLGQIHNAVIYRDRLDETRMRKAAC
jgi:hypothetical protein